MAVDMRDELTEARDHIQKVSEILELVKESLPSLRPYTKEMVNALLVMSETVYLNLDLLRTQLQAEPGKD